MADLSDEKLMLLEQIVYMDPEVFKAAGVTPFTTADLKSGTNVNKLLERFDEASLNRLRLAAVIEPLKGKDPYSGSYTTYDKWADIIQGIQKSDVANLQIYDSMKDPNDPNSALAITYKDPITNKPYVTFKGTSGGEEWADNAYALNKTDSPKQLAALAYIESLEFSNITVVGHSKGSNKAMYVTIRSDKVSKCIGMDGQGFSKEFLIKYFDRIQEKGGLITNYSIKGDYVNILLNQIPGSNQKWVEGDKPRNFLMNHSPGLFFSVDPQTKKIIFDADGSPIVHSNEKRLPGLDVLSEFTQFMNMNGSHMDKDKLSKFMGPLLGYSFSKGDLKNMYLQELKKVPEGPSLILAYLGKYVVSEDLSNEDIIALSEVVMDGLGLSDEKKEKYRGYIKKLAGLGGYTLKELFKCLGDGKRNFVIEKLLEQLDDVEIDGMRINFLELWRQAEGIYPTIDVKADWKNSASSSGRKIDFTDKALDTIFSTMISMAQNAESSLSTWESYDSEDWYFDVKTDLAILAFKRYFKLIEETNHKCREDIKKIFEEVWKEDTSSKNKIVNDINELQKIVKAVTEIAQKIG